MLTPRRPVELARRRYDVIIVGGGVYGLMLSLEATKRGLTPLLVERGDFAAETSHNSLRIIHGGFRYLQSLDLRRFRESVAERHWFLRTFPEFVRPLPCLLPLYNRGLQRPPVLRAALALNDVLSWRRNRGVRSDRVLPGGRVIGRDETVRLFPDVDPRGLVGGATWTDAFAPDMPRLMIAILHRACASGAAVLNYVEATGLLRDGPRVAGITAVDRAAKSEPAGKPLEFRAPVVINAAGPWARQFAAACGDDRPDLFAPCLTWNVVFDRPPLSDYGLAVPPRRRGARAYFLVPWKGVLFAGTGQAPWSADNGPPRVSEACLQAFIDDLNDAIPGLGVRRDEVARVFGGVQPAVRPGSDSPASRVVFVDHQRKGGPQGLFSVSGVKLTTARRVADTMLRRVFPHHTPALADEDASLAAEAGAPSELAFGSMPASSDRQWLAPLERAAATESVVHVSDLILRRSSLGDNPARALALAPAACERLGHEGAAARLEMDRLRRELTHLCDPCEGMTAGARRRIASPARSAG